MKIDHIDFEGKLKKLHGEYFSLFSPQKRVKCILSEKILFRTNLGQKMLTYHPYFCPIYCIF